MAHHVKIRFGLFFIVRTIAKPTNRIAEDSTKSLSIDLLPLNNVSERAKYVACQGYGIRDFGMLANHGRRPSRPRPNYLFLFWVFPIMILFRLGLLEVWLEVSGWRFLPCRARVQFFSFLMENILTMGGQIA